MNRDDETIEERIANGYMKPLFGYAKSRTANLVEAEELTSEILLQIYDSLRKGDEIRDLPRWIWSIARYTYGRYLTRRKAEAGIIGTSPDIFPDRRTRNPEDELEYRELINQIRKRVAFLSETHHRIIVLRYFRNRKIDEIAEELGIPAGTVKWHLHEIRKGLKEGEEDMSYPVHEQLETLACAPELLTVGYNGRLGTSIRPSRIVNDHLIVQNILLTTYPKPKTTGEIAGELGIPTPYIADEVRQLCAAELLIENDNGSYITDFIIQNQTILEQWYRIIEEHLQFYIDTIAYFEKHREKISSIISPHAETEDDYRRALWTLIPYALFDAELILNMEETHARPRRRDGGRWVVMARHTDPNRDDFYREYAFTKIRGNFWGCDDENNLSWGLETKWTGFGTHRRALLQKKWQSVRPLIDTLIEGDMRIAAIDETDAELFAELCECGVISVDGGTARIEAMWLGREQSNSLEHILGIFFKTNRKKTRLLYQQFQDVVARYAPPNVVSQIPVVSTLPVLEIAMFVVNSLCNSGYLPELDENEQKRIMILLQGKRPITVPE